METARTQIPGYEGLYSVCDDGKVWKSDGSELKPHLHGVARRNYYQVTLYKPNPEGGSKLKKTWRVHVLCGMAWFGHESTREWVIDHDDNDPLNNKRGNLKVLDSKTNCMKDRRNVKKPWLYPGHIMYRAERSTEDKF